tara:strand:- start:1278 stop:1679 length:402 start_codon:yes stop_codon:yes gene_type:complete
MANKVEKTENEWKEILTPEQFTILREKGTEAPFTGKYNDFKADGTFACAGCGEELFDSATKFDSGTGWPSFYQPFNGECIEEQTDTSHGMVRNEVLCGNCGGHLGHLFPDGPNPTGLRYCINSMAMTFEGNAK